MTILDELAELAKNRVAGAKARMPLEELKDKVYTLPKKDFAFEKALKKDGMAFICEVKKASPSKGMIASDFPYQEIAMEYQKAGADCISVLTEPYYFKGGYAFLEDIANQVTIPVLRKDFVVDEYMIYHSALICASAVLLICSLLDTETLRQYIDVCDSLGLSALVEAHDEQEIQSAVSAGARVIGVNNRNLKDFTVDINNCIRLRKYVPDHITFVAESGIKTAEDISKLRQAGVNAVLIGETLMRAQDKKAKLNELRTECIL